MEEVEAAAEEQYALNMSRAMNMGRDTAVYVMGTNAVAGEACLGFGTRGAVADRTVVEEVSREMDRELLGIVVSVESRQQRIRLAQGRTLHLPRCCCFPCCLPFSALVFGAIQKRSVGTEEKRSSKSCIKVGS